MLLFGFPKIPDVSAIFSISFGLSMIAQKSSNRHSRGQEVPFHTRNKEWATWLLFFSPTSPLSLLSQPYFHWWLKPVWQTINKQRNFQWRNRKRPEGNWGQMHFFNIFTEIQWNSSIGTKEWFSIWSYDFCFSWEAESEEEFLRERHFCQNCPALRKCHSHLD